MKVKFSMDDEITYFYYPNEEGVEIDEGVLIRWNNLEHEYHIMQKRLKELFEAQENREWEGQR